MLNACSKRPILASGGVAQVSETDVLERVREVDQVRPVSSMESWLEAVRNAVLASSREQWESWQGMIHEMGEAADAFLADPENEETWLRFGMILQTMYNRAQSFQVNRDEPPLETEEDLASFVVYTQDEFRKIVGQ